MSLKVWNFYGIFTVLIGLHDVLIIFEANDLRDVRQRIIQLNFNYAPTNRIRVRLRDSKASVWSQTLQKANLGCRDARGLRDPRGSGDPIVLQTQQKGNLGSEGSLRFEEPIASQMHRKANPPGKESVATEFLNMLQQQFKFPTDLMQKYRTLIGDLLIDLLFSDPPKTIERAAFDRQELPSVVVQTLQRTFGGDQHWHEWIEFVEEQPPVEEKFDESIL